MDYEEFKREVERILLEKGRPMTWSEIRNSSEKLNQRAPYHGRVHKLRGEIGLMEIKDKGTGRKLWALRRWFKGKKSGRQTFFSPPKTVVVTLLCKAKEQFSRRHKMLTHCIAGLDKDWKWRRLYPLSADAGSEIRKWDVIEAVVKNFFPEANRPESIKIWPREVKRIARIQQIKERRRIIKGVVETGEFLHRDSWKGKTLGLIKPKRPKFYIENGEVKCDFYCDQRRCSGHTMVVWDCEVNERRDFVMFESGEPYFLLGTHKYHPNKFLLISVINLSKPRQKRLMDS